MELMLLRRGLSAIVRNSEVYVISRFDLYLMGGLTALSVNDYHHDSRIIMKRTVLAVTARAR